MADQINPTHYKKAPPGIEHECIGYTRHMSFNTGNAAKYAYRAGAKGHAEVDLRHLLLQQQLGEADRPGGGGLCRWPCRLSGHGSRRGL